MFTSVRVFFRVFVVIAVAILLTACENESNSYAPEISSELVMIAVNKNGEIFISTRESSLSLGEFSSEVSRLLNEGGSYSFVLQSDEGGYTNRKKVEKMLHDNGVTARHIVISRNRS